MMDQLRGIAASLAAPVRHIASDLAQDVLERAIVAAFAATALAFGLAAATIWLAMRHGALTATLMMTGLCTALAILALLVRVGRSRARRRRRLERERARASLATAAQAAAIATDIGAAANRLNPWVLVAAAPAAGYAGIRKVRP